MNSLIMNAPDIVPALAGVAVFLLMLPFVWKAKEQQPQN